MSAINKMLQQLSEKDTSLDGRPGLQAASIRPVPRRWPWVVCGCAVLVGVAAGGWWLGQRSSAPQSAVTTDPQSPASTPSQPVLESELVVTLPELPTDALTGSSAELAQDNAVNIAVVSQADALPETAVTDSYVTDSYVAETNVTKPSALSEKDAFIEDAALLANEAQPVNVTTVSDAPVSTNVLARVQNAQPAAMSHLKAATTVNNQLAAKVQPLPLDSERAAPSGQSVTAQQTATQQNVSQQARSDRQILSAPEVNTASPAQSSSPDQGLASQEIADADRAANATTASADQEELAASSAQGELSISVESLTSDQLAAQAKQRAKTAMDRGDLQQALADFQTALNYAPDDEPLRSQVAALLYGRRETNHALGVLKQGIERNPASQHLRLTMAKILSKESDPQQALTALMYWPNTPTVEYAALRGALAQQLNRNNQARESYQYLTEQLDNDGRWWLGLAIATDRDGDFVQAEQAYQKAGQFGGISAQSQQFVRQRLAALQQQRRAGEQ
uniref:tetratricopeptide repeat protein n=1 Tax=Thaumasiovibrio occultus TaxID=1891184 RepID=UPI000B35429D|nr:tetratricopeptide repeat protein [Thaumasiovibrio occultus]